MRINVNKLEEIKEVARELEFSAGSGLVSEYDSEMLTIYIHHSTIVRAYLPSGEVVISFDNYGYGSGNIDGRALTFINELYKRGLMLSD